MKWKGVQCDLLLDEIFSRGDAFEGAPETVELRESISHLFDTLSPREVAVLRRRFTLPTYKEIAQELGVTSERVRQVQAKAFRKLRHPSRSRRLVRFLPPPPGELRQ